MTTTPCSMLSSETNTLRKFYVALNQNDIPAALKLLDPQIERIEFEGLPTGGVYRGLTELEAHMTQGRATWAEGSCEPEKFIPVGNKIVVFVHVRVKLKKNLEWVEGRIADGFTFRNGKILQFRSFLERSEALAWAEIKDL